VKTRGQALVLFAIFLVVLLGAAALAIDYANWLLTDRALQNVTDHAALSGASVFRQTVGGTNCREDPTSGDCEVAARTQAWTSLNQDLSLGLDAAEIDALAARDSPSSGDASDAGGGPPADFRGQTIWVSVPPPRASQYTNIPGNPIGHGRLANQQGVVFARVDRPTQSYLAGVFGITARDRVGWATAGFLPNDFALEVFCRDGTDPSGSNSSCVSKGIGIDGQGGITLIKGDIGSNESLQVSAQTGQGVILEDGNMFLANVNDTCGPSTWNCPPATLGGITDGNGNAKDAFYIPPQPYLQFSSPLDGSTPTGDTTVSSANCSGADASHLCVPYQGNASHDWWCDNGDLNNLCGVPTPSIVNGLREIKCEARLGGTPSRDLVPNSDGTGANGFSGSPAVSNGNRYTNIDDDPATPDPDTTSPPADPSQSFIYTSNLGVSGGGATQAGTFNLRPPYGIPQAGNPSTLSYVVFKTYSGVEDNAGNPVTVSVQLLQGGGVIFTDPTVRTLTGTPSRYDVSVPSGTITNYTALSIRFTFTSSGVNTSSEKRGGAIAWAEVQTPTLNPAVPPMIPPGYYHSISVPISGSSPSCAIMDPTGVYSGLQSYQMPGIYRFGTGNNDSSISIGPDSYLIGDGVSLVFDPSFPDPTGGKGIVIGADGALVINTARTSGNPACTAEAETIDYNPDSGGTTPPVLTPLPVAAVCAAWAVKVSDAAIPRPGVMNWISSDVAYGGTTTTRGYCDPTVRAINGPSQCVRRDDYSPVSGYRGVAFFFRTSGWPPTTIRSRFQISGTSGSEPGVAFRGIMYAPWDNVKLTGGNGFNTIGQIFAWTAKFAGQSTIYLDYPYARCESDDSCLPYLLEPSLRQ
jgi:hypothetical protein